ncbi:MAG: RDD family protein [Bacteroidia bacterium]|nr:RDD family protein [Bacteroidia bacterium]
MDQDYPKLIDRIKAAFVDVLVLLALMVAVSSIFSSFDNVPDGIRIAAFIFIFGLYDPIFTSMLGGTLGHMIIGIRVKKESNQKDNISFLLAIIRFIIKALLGWISLLTVTSNKKRKAIHDSVVGSVVVYNK